MIKGPLVSALVDKFGARKVVMCSSSIFSLMYVISPFMPNIYLIILTFGFVGGSHNYIYLFIFIKLLFEAFFYLYQA